MILLLPEPISITSCLKIAARVGFALASVAVLWIVFLLFIYEETSLEQKEKAALGVDLAASYEKIGEGPFGASSHGISQALHGLIVLGRNLRPDCKEKRPQVLLGLKGSTEKHIATAGEKLFLDREEASSALHFSEKDTHLSIKPLKVERATVTIEVCKNEGEREDKTTVQLRVEPTSQKEMPFFKALKEGKYWGRDLLIQGYGGEQYRLLKNKQKVELSSENASYVCFVETGDYLIWKEGRWQVSPLSQALEDTPLAHIKAVSGKNVEIEAWDESGFNYAQIKLPLQTPPKLQMRNEQMPASIRRRTATQVTCVLGKRRVILKQGDWLFKTSSGWRNLKKVEEIDDVLEHRLKGELFLFEALEKQENALLLKGHLFDEMRTQSLPVTLSIAVEKRKKVKKEKSLHEAGTNKENNAAKSTRPLA